MDLGLSGIQVLGIELTPVEVEAVAGLIKQYPLPVHCEVVEWGVYVTEDFVAQATDPVVSIVKIDKVSGTETEIDALTLGADNTNLHKGDGLDAEKTQIVADADLDNGHVVVAQEKQSPSQSPNIRSLAPGDVLAFRRKVAATGAGGAYVPWVQLKMSGIDARRDDVWHEKE